MALSLSNLVRKKSDKPPRCLFYGVPGVGKSTLAAEFPNPIFLQTEDGAGNLELTTFTDKPFTKFSQFEEAIEILWGGEHDFQTVVVDSLDWLEPIIWAETCRIHSTRDKPLSTIEEFGYGKGYVAAADVWRRFFKAMNTLRDDRNMTLIYLAHEEIKKFDDPERDGYDQYRLKMNKYATDIAVENADVVGFLNYIAVIRKEKGGFNKETAKASGSGQRALFLNQRPAFTAKNRYDMPDQLLINRGQGYAALAPYLPGHRDAAASAAA